MLKLLCHSSQAGGSSSCPPALSQPHTPFPALPRVGLGVPVLLRVTLQAGPVTALPGENGLFVLSRPSMSPQTQGRTTGPVLCVLQGGPADRQGGDSSAAPSASLSGASHAVLGLGALWHSRGVSCGIWGVPYPLWGHSGPLCHRGVQGHRAELPLSAEQGAGLAGTAIMGTMPWGQSLGLTWSWQGLGDSGTLLVSLLCTLGCLCHSLENAAGSRTPLGHKRDQTRRSLAAPKSPQPHGLGQAQTRAGPCAPSCQGLPRPGAVWAMLSPRGDRGSRDTLCGRAGSLIARGCCLSGPGAHGRGLSLSPPRSRVPGMPAWPGTNSPAGWHSTGCRMWPCGDRQGWGTQVTGVMHRQVTLMVGGGAVWGHAWSGDKCDQGHVQ